MLPKPGEAPLCWQRAHSSALGSERQDVGLSKGRVSSWNGSRKKGQMLGGLGEEGFAFSTAALLPPQWPCEILRKENTSLVLLLPYTLRT